MHQKCAFEQFKMHQKCNLTGDSSFFSPKSQFWCIFFSTINIPVQESWSLNQDHDGDQSQKLSETENASSV